jgi:rRNA processing protein Gar1
LNPLPPPGIGVLLLKKLGRLHVIARDGSIVVESMVKNPDKLVGAIVYNKDMRRIGRVYDVIGRVDKPYVIVRPNSKELVEDLEQDAILYYYMPRPRKSRRRRGGSGRKK